MSVTPFPTQGQYPWYDQLEQWGADTQSAAESAELNADALRADVATALSDSTAASAAAIAAAGLVGAPAGEAVLAAVSEGGAARGEIVDLFEQPPVNAIKLLSQTDKKADSKRLHIRSFQKQEAENNYDGGETVWLDVSPTAKSMLTWRLPVDWGSREVIQYGPYTETQWQRVVWAGAHWYAQDQPDDNNPTVIHGHWSVETPRPNGELHTRFQIFFNDRADKSKVGAEVAMISTNRAHFMVERQTHSGENSGRFILAGAQNLSRGIDFTRNDEAATNQRWFLGVNAFPETGSDEGADFVLNRFSDSGAALGTSVYVRRANGSITVGSSDWAPPSDPSLIMVKSAGGTANGVFVYPSNALTTGAAFKARLSSVNESAFQVRVGVSVERFNISADGKVAWGDGASVPDTTLYRDAAGRLKTDGDFVAGGNLRLGSLPAAGGKSVVAVPNATTAPSGASGAGFWLYAEAGVPKFLTKTGAVIQLNQQAAIANATDDASTQAALNDLLAKLRTIGLIAS